ncbi:MAG TPA: GNAT family N-acetyltransferase [Allosphingosinicella sp.]
MFPDRFSTARLSLRPMLPDDAHAIFTGYAQDEEVTRYLTWRPHTSIDQTKAYVQACIAAETARAYMLVLKETGRGIGVFDLRKAGDAKLEYGYVVARPFWGKGLMTEALVDVIDWALCQPAIWRIAAAADVDNIGSIRVMEKAGLQWEGVLRKWLIHPNIGPVPRDCVVFAKTRP